MQFTKILKFGGSSVGMPRMIKKVGQIILDEIKRNSHGRIRIAGAPLSGAEGAQFACVVSAFQGVTDQLLKCAKLAAKNNPQLEEELKSLKDRHLKAVTALVRTKKCRKEAEDYVENLFKELSSVLEKIKKEKIASPKNLDWAASFGERLSAYIVAAYLYQVPGIKYQAYFVDARELVKTDNNFMSAAVDFKKTNLCIQNYFKNKKGTPVITGFLGSTGRGETTTLGRGGSDYAAAIFGAALGVKAIEIWTDVDGVMSADPRLVKNAQVLPEMSYEEAVEMAYFGAKVIHPATMFPVIKKGIPILIKNTFNPSAPGTLIKKDSVSTPMIKGITSIDDIALIIVEGVSLAGIPGSAARVFEATKRAGANVVLISQASSEHTICFAIKSSELKTAIASLKKEFRKEIKSGKVGINTILNQSVLAMVGDGMRGIPGIAGKLFSIIGNNGVNVTAIAQGGSERNISFVVDSVNKVKALNVVHDEFFTGGAKNLFIIGAGNIGGALLNQIRNLQKQGVNLRVCGIIDALSMLLDDAGINLAGWEKKLRKSEKSEFEKWFRWAKSLPLGNKVFVDCTASEEIAKRYLEIAEAGFHIVTPNKKFNVRPIKEYQRLRDIMTRNKRRFLYETNVGAALPVISTLQDLLKTGDKITKIEGVFSGTLSYIFNTFDGNRSFSQVVGTAKKMGYTEPDPREDLNGNDVGRKLLVLAREIGLEMEMKNIKIENLVSRALSRVRAAEDFLKALPKQDDYFKKRLERAKKKNKVLRYVAELGPVRGREELVPLEAADDVPRPASKRDSQRASASNGMGWLAKASLQAVSLDNPLAFTKDADNIFAFYTKRYNKRPLVVQGPGAGREVTAAGVLADILKI